jgi:hypothetical protein
LGEETNGSLSQEKKQSFFDLVGVRDSRCPVITGVSLLLTQLAIGEACDLREEEQNKVDFRTFSSPSLLKRL